MINNMQVSIKDEIAHTLNEYLNHADVSKLILIDNYFELSPDRLRKDDYGDMMDCILFFCLDSLSNSIAVLDFINNDYKYGV